MGNSRFTPKTFVLKAIMRHFAAFFTPTYAQRIVVKRVEKHSFYMYNFVDNAAA